MFVICNFEIKWVISWCFHVWLKIGWANPSYTGIHFKFEINWPKEKRSNNFFSTIFLNFHTCGRKLIIGCGLAHCEVGMHVKKWLSFSGECSRLSRCDCSALTRRPTSWSWWILFLVMTKDTGEPMFFFCKVFAWSSFSFIFLPKYKSPTVLRLYIQKHTSRLMTKPTK